MSFVSRYDFDGCLPTFQIGCRLKIITGVLML